MHERIAGAPALEEARDRRVQVRARRARERRTTRTSRTAGSLEARSSGASGSGDGVDHVHDVPARAVARRGDRLGERDGLAGGQAAQAALLGQLAPERVLHRLPRLDAAAGQQPVGAPRLLVAHEHERVAAVAGSR